MSDLRNQPTLPKIPSNPNLIVKEIAAAAIFLTAVCLLSVLADAPTAGPADPTGVPAEGVKAPWIFVGIQQLLRYFPPLLAGIIAPLTALAFLACLPWARGKSVTGRRIALLIFFTTAWIAIAITTWGYFYE